MSEFVKQINQHAVETLRQDFGREILASENPVLELMGLLLGDGFGEVQPLPRIPITSQRWLDWHHLILMRPEKLTVTLNLVLERQQRRLPKEQTAMRTWAASLLLQTLEELEMM
jgi:hypothetical protein